MSDEGAGSADGARDFEVCHALAGADPDGDEMFSALVALWAHYLARADMVRVHELLVTVRGMLGGERAAYKPANGAGFGLLDWFSGRFDDALEVLEANTRELDERGIDIATHGWFVPNDQIAPLRVQLGLAQLIKGDLAGAEENFARARERASRLEFPQGPWTTAYVCWLGSWAWSEAGQLDRAAALVEEIAVIGERHGFESWKLVAAMHAAVLEGSSAEVVDGLAAMWEAAGLRILLSYHLTMAGALHAADGDTDTARDRYDAALALSAETGMRFYDAETRRRLAHLDPDPEPGLRAALALARSQGALLFERRIERDLRA
jgi:tetratricopeptide (TPR) repeat protein